MGFLTLFMLETLISKSKNPFTPFVLENI
jgi:hypothetical protein